MGPPLRSFAADAHDCIVVPVLGPTAYKVVARFNRARKRLPSDCHPDCIIVLEAVRMSPGEIKHEVVVDSLKALDPEWPIREADIDPLTGTRLCRCGAN